ncbi:chromate resistance protein [Bradyrhizobium sp. Pear77]|uniref:chromate resistance protein ChrB domain-containing protein n=1 Tax=Bradyrhizobium altum TaxID=1571202 RepID=UPI001E436879|nr:chromate resistance protein ChrB domain-containing protein [Bradyrhizobium altum]MCC8953512.1 chromate resistance protein [Bradyrhizobium altum]
MSDATVETVTEDRWLLLIHQLPAKPAYLRVKIWRRLQSLGAVAVKNAVYALPANEQTQEDFEWVLKEIIEGGGEAMICAAQLIDGVSDQEVRTLFTAARDEDYEAIAKEANALAETLRGDPNAKGQVGARTQLTRMRARMAQVVAIDFFGANGRETVDGLLIGLGTRLTEGTMAETSQRGAADRTADLARLKDRTWVTREGVHVDRIACAWLIRRFIDPGARFKFVSAKDYTPSLGELRFDMFEAEFTHQGDHCSFEVLLGHAGLTDPALQAIAEIVHDIDLKDSKFGRGETDGIKALIAGVVMAHRKDEERLTRGGAIFDDLYEYFSKKRS